MKEIERKGGNAPKRKKKKKANKQMIVLIVLMVILIIVGVVLIILLTGNNSEEPEVEESVGGRGTVVTQENVEEILRQIREPVPDGHYVVRMSLEWTFDKWDVISRNAYVENSPDNMRTVYFDLFLDSTGELIYSSPYIPLGSRLENFALDEEVPAGEHSATVTYRLVDDDYNVLTDVSVGVTLKINN